MLRCHVCHAAADPSDVFCGDCGASLTGDENLSSGSPDGVGGSLGSRSSGSETVAQNLAGTPLLLGDGEVVWRRYRVSQLRRRKQGEGVLYVTDARLVFYARAKGRGAQRASSLVQQTKVGEVTGLTAFVSRRVSVGWLLATVLLALLLIRSLLNGGWRGALLFAVLLAGAITMLLLGAARHGSVGVQIHSGATQASPIAFGQFGEQQGIFGQLAHTILQPLTGLLGIHTAFDVLLGFPGEDAELVIAELGALIFDMQSLGSLAGTHWGLSATMQNGPR